MFFTLSKIKLSTSSKSFAWFYFKNNENMGRKCVIFCKGNWDDENKEKIFRLPSSKRNAQERERWIKSLPNSIHDSVYTSICERHWPPGYNTISVHGKLRPADPPSIFRGVKKSLLPTAPSKPRPTSRNYCEVRKKRKIN